MGYDVTIPWAINTLLDSFECKTYDLPKYNNSDVIYFDDFPEFSFRSINYTPNLAFSKSVYRFILKDHYQLIDELIVRQYKSFEIPARYFFISKKLIRETDLINLLDWIDDQIYHFELVSFDYNLEVLIRRYYIENQKDVPPRSLEDLFPVISNLKKETLEINEGALKRFTRKRHIDSVLNEVYLFLKEKNEGQMTNAILDHLNQKNLAMEKEDLLRHLNNHKSTFTSFGMGNWTLVEWNNSNENLSGSFREIVRNLLSKRTDPIHISELYKYINSLKKVSLASMMSNLKSETEGTFKFFNCSYIGLAEKEYLQYWHEVPKIKPVHINKNVFSVDGDIDEEKVNNICLKYGYPKQHVNFILDCRKGKYN